MRPFSAQFPADAETFQSVLSTERGARGERAEVVSARHVHFRYGKTVVLRDVSLPLYRHNVTSLMGPSGCGKSTLLRIFNRMHELYPNQHVTGEVLMNGENILASSMDVNRLRARIGMVAQVPAPFPMSIYENVAYGIRLHTVLPRQELDGRIEAALRRAALWEEVKDMLQSDGRALSGGQQQRLCIARTIAIEPEVILLDEPCSALDPISTAKIEETIRELRANYTIAIITHNLNQAARISDFTAFMYLGEVTEFSDTHQLFTSPQQERTREYLTGRFG